MKKYTIAFIFIVSCLICLQAQYNWVLGGNVNGDFVTIRASTKEGKVTGVMEDSKQSYELTGTLIGSIFEAKASNTSLGITFLLIGRYSNNTLNIDGYIDNSGTNQKAFTASLVQAIADGMSDQSQTHQKESETSTSQTSSAPSAVESKTIDPLIIGLWKEESHYNSGYGDQAFSGSTYSYMTFNRDHTMSDNGSQATMSGSNYSGNAGGQATAKVIPNLWYFTSNGKIMVYLTENGQQLTTELGSYYIENGKMLFTQVNTGKKILYTKM
jgi:hypothetical protein